MSESTANPMNRTEVINALANKTGLTKQQVGGLLDELKNLIADNLKDGGPGVFNLPGLMKIKVTRKPALPERPGKHPFTKEDIMLKAKPAYSVVKIVPLKGLKDAV